MSKEYNFNDDENKNENINEEVNEGVENEGMEEEVSSNVKPKKSGRPINKPIIFAVVGLVVIVVGIILVGIFAKNNKSGNTSKRRQEVKQEAYVEETQEEIVETTKKVSSKEDILARVRQEERQNSGVEETIENDIEGQEEVNDASVSETDDIENNEEEKVEFIIEKEPTNYRELQFSGDIDTRFRITNLEQKENKIDEWTTKLEFEATGSLGGFSGLYKLTLPYSETWKRGDEVCVKYKMAEIEGEDNQVVVIDLRMDEAETNNLRNGKATKTDKKVVKTQ